MNAMEKVAWTELVVSVAAITLAVLLLPVLGDSAAAAFAILGLLPLGMVFLRPRGNEVTVDERDRAIENRAKIWGIGAAWMTLFIVLTTAGMLSNYEGMHSLSTRFINWLIWIQFAICYGVKGLTSVILHRRQQHAA